MAQRKLSQGGKDRPVREKHGRWSGQVVMRAKDTMRLMRPRNMEPGNPSDAHGWGEAWRSGHLLARFVLSVDDVREVCLFLDLVLLHRSLWLTYLTST